MQIKGRVYTANTNSKEKLLTESTSSKKEHVINHDEELAYNVYFSQSPTANDDCIFYAENSSANDLVAAGVWLYVSAACEIYLQINDKGTRNSATDVIPVNLNGGSGNTADGNFEYGADLDGGGSTLAGGKEFQRYKFKGETDTTFFNFEQDIILPKNATITMWCSSLTPTVNATVIFNYHVLEAA